MNLVKIALSAVCLSFTPLRAQNPSPLIFVESTHNFGKILETDGPVSHTFEFSNGGQTPVAIDRIITSCGCTTPDYPRRPIEPGEKASVRVTFNPSGFAGRFEKSISVVNGGNKNRNFLIISGFVVSQAVEDTQPQQNQSSTKSQSAQEMQLVPNENTTTTENNEKKQP